VVNAAVSWFHTGTAPVDEGCSAGFNSTGGTITNARATTPNERGVPPLQFASGAGVMTATFTDVQGSGRLRMDCGAHASGVMTATKVATFH